MAKKEKLIAKLTFEIELKHKLYMLLWLVWGLLPRLFLWQYFCDCVGTLDEAENCYGYYIEKVIK